MLLYGGYFLFVSSTSVVNDVKADNRFKYRDIAVTNFTTCVGACEGITLANCTSRCTEMVIRGTSYGSHFLSESGNWQDIIQ